MNFKWLLLLAFSLLVAPPLVRAGAPPQKDYLSALTYVLNLGRSEALSHVQLARHEVRTTEPQRPVSFSVSATWSARK